MLLKSVLILDKKVRSIFTYITEIRRGRCRLSMSKVVITHHQISVISHETCEIIVSLNALCHTMYDMKYSFDYTILRRPLNRMNTVNAIT